MIKIVFDKKHKKEAFILCIGSFLGIIFFLTSWMIELRNTRNYVSIQAEIVGFNKENGRSAENIHNIYKCVIYIYQYKNREYVAEQRVLTFWNKKEGEQDIIYINPTNPMEIRDIFDLRSYLVFTIVCVVIFLISGYVIIFSG